MCFPKDAPDPEFYEARNDTSHAEETFLEAPHAQSLRPRSPCDVPPEPSPCMLQAAAELHSGCVEEAATPLRGDLQSQAPHDAHDSIPAPLTGRLQIALSTCTAVPYCWASHSLQRSPAVAMVQSLM